MMFAKTAIVSSALFLFIVAPNTGQGDTLPDARSTTAGLRVLLDSEGNRVQPDSKGNPGVAPVATPPAKELRDANAGVEASAGDFQRAAITAPASDAESEGAGPQVIKKGSAGTVVRLNGLFRAGSRAQIGPDGKLQGDCHIDIDGKGHSK